jgi:two-component system, LuxR family, response regulator FixJ
MNWNKGQVIFSQGDPADALFYIQKGKVKVRTLAAMKLGAVDFFEKPFDGDALLASIRAALARTDGRRQSEAETQMIRGRLATLSEREMEVLACVLEGQLNKTIAQTLGLSARTVEVHRANVMTKTHATSLAELVKIALSCKTAGGSKPSHDPGVLSLAQR